MCKDTETKLDLKKKKYRSRGSIRVGDVKHFYANFIASETEHVAYGP